MKTSALFCLLILLLLISASGCATTQGNSGRSQTGIGTDDKEFFPGSYEDEWTQHPDDF